MPTISSQPSQDSRPIVALAILRHGDHFLMQLRDDDPSILYPGQWGLFGGHLEPGETPEAGVRRELLEEIGYCPAELTLLGRYDDTYVIRFIYQGVLEVDLTQLVLGEGMDMALVSSAEVERGDRYSEHIRQVRPLGKPHRQMVLDVITGEWEMGNGQS